MPSTKHPLVLTILDGWGYRAETANNAIALARKPTYDKLLREFPNTLIRASEHFVGLPDGQMGNSEVGHLNIGAGRIVQMDITRIDALIASGEFAEEPVNRAGHAARARGRPATASLRPGLRRRRALAPGASLRAAAHRARIRPGARLRARLHGWPRHRPDLRRRLHCGSSSRRCASTAWAKWPAINGRYYAMDRDKRWERERKAFDAMVNGKAEGGAYADPVARIKENYNNGMTDEFLIPFVVVDAAGKPVGQIRDEDVCINFNFRADRARQITRVLARESGLNKKGGRDLEGWESLDETIPRSEIPKNLHYLCMTQYDKLYELPLVILPESMDNILANILSAHQSAQPARGRDGKVRARHVLLQRRHRNALPRRRSHADSLAEGGHLRSRAGDEGRGIGDTIVKAVNDTAFDLVVANFANADMVGHSGKLEPTIKACEAVDAQLGRIYKAIKEKNGSWLITADHGNAELMVDPVTGGPHTAHTTNPVPMIYVAKMRATIACAPTARCATFRRRC